MAVDIYEDCKLKNPLVSMVLIKNISALQGLAVGEFNFDFVIVLDSLWFAL